MTYLRPTSLEEALELRASRSVQVIAGATDVYPMMANAQAWGTHNPGAMLDISALENLRGLQEVPDHWRIGALATWSDIISADLPPAFDGLKLAAQEIGGKQIQNRGTLAGNICNASPAADGVPPLLALDAEIEVSSQSGTRRIPLTGFIDDYRHTVLAKDELVTAILIPKLPEKSYGHFLKLGARRYLVISIAMASVVVVLDEGSVIADVRLALGACSPVAVRLAQLEEDIKGRKLDGSLGEVPTLTHLEDLTPIADIRASAEYRLHAALKLLREILHQLGSGKRREISDA